MKLCLQPLLGGLYGIERFYLDCLAGAVPLIIDDYLPNRADGNNEGSLCRMSCYELGQERVDDPLGTLRGYGPYISGIDEVL